MRLPPHTWPGTGRGRGAGGGETLTRGGRMLRRVPLSPHGEGSGWEDLRLPRQGWMTSCHPLCTAAPASAHRSSPGG